MVDIEIFKQIALSFEGTEQNPHFDRTAFKVIGKRIFATLHEKSKTANIVFSKADQAMYCSFDNQSVYPVANKWGEQGWTTFELEKVAVELVSDALLTAYNDVLKKPGKKRQPQAIKKIK
jgi:predicted DNA-binding protein (MmcQ/YjbR family)